MLAAARKRNLHVEHHDATALPYEHQFDAVFSNAALHWIPASPANKQCSPESTAHSAQAAASSPRWAATATSPPSAPPFRPPRALRNRRRSHRRQLLPLTRDLSPPPRSRRLHRSIHRTHPPPHPTHQWHGSWLNTFRNGVLDQLYPTDRAQPSPTPSLYSNPSSATPTATGPPTTSASVSTPPKECPAQKSSVQTFSISPFETPHQRLVFTVPPSRDVAESPPKPLLNQSKPIFSPVSINFHHLESTSQSLSGRSPCPSANNPPTLLQPLQ